MTQSSLVALEETILKELEFSMHYAGPIPFLERFLKIMGLDTFESPGRYIEAAARQFLVSLQRCEEFLKYKPSHCAAACLILAINIS
jgi:Cyclin, C-terminal domain